MTLVHRRSALIALALVLPFFILNFIVALRIEPLYSALGSLGVLTGSPWLPSMLLMLFPMAVFVAIRPMLHRRTCGSNAVYPVNIVLGAILLAATIFLWNGLGQDIIACDILRIPNCD